VGRSSISIAGCLLGLALAACSSSSSPPGAAQVDGDDGGAAAADVGAANGADGAAAESGDAGVPTGTASAGAAGVDAFCAQICGHEQDCAAALDASPPGLASCESSCRSANESAAANPPTELLRADYVKALGACIASASCDEALQTSEASCAAAVVTGADGGTPLEPTQAVAIFCRDFESSPCLGADAGTADCVSTTMLYSDTTLDAADACLADTSCSIVTTCYTAAFTQP
jgi:hypothetical protein